MSATEQRLEEALALLARLNDDRETLEAALADFEARETEQLSSAVAELQRAQQVERRLERLREELEAERTARAPGRRRRDRTHHGGAGENDKEAWLRSIRPPPPAPPDPERDPRTLYRKLARKLHPDGAGSEEERARRSRLMMRLNAAFAEEDLVQLELLAAEVSAGFGALPEHDARPSDHAERRVREIEVLIEGLERDLRRLRSTALHRRLTDARTHEVAGRDFILELRARTLESARAARATFAERAARVEEAARAFNQRFAAGASEKSAALSALDPPLPFRAAVSRTEGSASAEGTTARRLRALAEEAPWKASWVLAAIFAEAAGRPPRSLATVSSWAAWHESLRAGRRGIPPFEEALAELPSLLELGCRIHEDGVRFGVMLKEPEPDAFDPEAIATDPCAVLAAELLTSIAPRAECAACARSVPLLHVYRLRDVDPLHAFLCSRCGAVVEKYRALGRAEGLEALDAWGRAIGLIAEVAVSFGGETLRVGLLSKERARLTAGSLTRLFAEVALDAAGVSSVPLAVDAGDRRLRKDERVPGDTPLTLKFRRRGVSERAAVDALRARYRKRFERP